MRRLEHWTRTHRISPPVRFETITSPISGNFVVRADGWRLPAHFDSMYATLEDAQRACDGLIAAYFPHDCRRAGCDDWTPADPRTLSHLLTDPDAPTH